MSSPCRIVGSCASTFLGCTSPRRHLDVFSVAFRNVTLQKDDCRISLYQGYLDPPQTQLIFWQGDIHAIARDLTGKGLSFERGPAKGDDGGTAAMLKDPDGHPIYFINMPHVVRKGPA